MTGAGGVGHFVSWDGGCLLIGRATGETPMHAHYAMQIAFGVERGIRFRGSDRDDWQAFGGVIIPSRQPHAMDATLVSSSVVLLVEPETRVGRALAERFVHGGITPLPDDLLADFAPPIFEAWHAGRGLAAIAEAARRLVQGLAGAEDGAVTVDARILRAITYMRNNLERSLTLDEVAAEACLSPSRFRHLFVEQTGMALRPYILWRRFVRVWELLAGGASISTAAHHAGFADAAHLTRTSRRMFGFPPSALQVGTHGGVDVPGRIPETDASRRLQEAREARAWSAPAFKR